MGAKKKKVVGRSLTRSELQALREWVGRFKSVRAAAESVEASDTTINNALKGKNLRHSTLNTLMREVRGTPTVSVSNGSGRPPKAGWLAERLRGETSSEGLILLRRIDAKLDKILVAWGIV